MGILSGYVADTADIKEQKEGCYSRYVSIGEYGGMDLGDKNKSPFGSGTYRMTLVLPEKEKQYAIGLTEIFFCLQAVY